MGEVIRPEHERVGKDKTREPIQRNRFQHVRSQMTRKSAENGGGTTTGAGAYSSKNIVRLIIGT